MLRKTVITLAKAAALTSGLTVEKFAHGGGRGQSWSTLRVVPRKLVAPTSRAASPFCGRLFEIAAVVVSRRYDGRGLRADGDAGHCGQQSGQSRAVLPAASALAKRHVDYGVTAAD